jgi:hypothetical protein
MQITEILSVDASTALNEPPRRARPEPRPAPSDQAAIEEFGTVKFYAADKGVRVHQSRPRRQGYFRARVDPEACRD